MCRLACCLDPALRARFCDYESKILRMRLESVPAQELVAMIKVLESKMKCEDEITQVTEEEMGQKMRLIVAGLRFRREF